MATESSRGMLIAILVVSAANLLVGALQTGLLLNQRPAATATVSSNGLPARFDAAAVAKVARRVTEPYNRGDVDAVYNAFDDVAKMQMPRAQFDAQIKAMVDLIGKVDSTAYEGAQKLANEGGMDAYQLKYVVKLSGGRFNSGEMIVNVIDRTSELGIYAFVINGKIQ